MGYAGIWPRLIYSTGDLTLSAWTDGSQTARSNKVQQIGTVQKMLDLFRSNVHVKWLIANSMILMGGVSTGRVTHQRGYPVLLCGH